MNRQSFKGLLRGLEALQKRGFCSVAWRPGRRTALLPFQPRSSGKDNSEPKPVDRKGNKSAPLTRKTSKHKTSPLSAGSFLPDAVEKRVGDYLASLNDEQITAVLCQSPAVRVKAGPGR